jgi:hypothetical protein
MRRSFFVLTSALVIAASSPAIAAPDDAFNPKTPFVAALYPGDPRVFVPSVVATVPASFSSRGPTDPPAIGWSTWTTTLPFPNSFSSSVVVASYGSKSRYFARSSSGDILWSVAPNPQTGSPGAWTSFGTPPGGTTSSPSAAGLAGKAAMVAVRGANGVAYRRPIAVNGGLGSWTTVGNAPIYSAPGIAMTDVGGQVRTDIVAIDVNGAVMISTCDPSSCFATWNYVPSGGGWGISQPNAAWLPAVPGVGGPYLAISLVGGDKRAYTNLLNTATGTWSLWIDRGGVCDTAVAIAPPLTVSAVPMLVIRNAAGDYLVNTSGTTWTSIGHP